MPAERARSAGVGGRPLVPGGPDEAVDEVGPARSSMTPNSCPGIWSPQRKPGRMDHATGARFVGIDVAKDRLDVHVLDGEVVAVDNSRSGRGQLVARLTALPGEVATELEASGGYEIPVL